MLCENPKKKKKIEDLLAVGETLLEVLELVVLLDLSKLIMTPREVASIRTQLLGGLMSAIGTLLKCSVYLRSTPLKNTLL